MTLSDIQGHLPILLQFFSTDDKDIARCDGGAIAVSSTTFAIDVLFNTICCLTYMHREFLIKNKLKTLTAHRGLQDATATWNVARSVYDR